MTPTQRAAMEQALEILDCIDDNDYWHDYVKGPLTDLRAALAEQPAEQEPVAWMSPGKERLEFSRKDTVYGSHTIPLYTAPQPAKRVPLTDEGVELVAQWLDRQMTDTPATGPMLAGAIRHAGAKRITGETE